MGSSAFGSEILSFDKEKDFYAAIKTYVTGLSTAITCANDPDTEFDRSESGDDHVPTLAFKINNVDVFKLFRPDQLYSGGEVAVEKIVFSMNVANGIPTSWQDMYFKEGNLGAKWSYNYSGKRGVMISHIVNDNFIFLQFTSLTTELQSRRTNAAGVLYSLTDDTVYVASSNTDLTTWDAANTFNLSGYTLYKIDNAGTSGTFLSRFSYAAPAGQIDYIKSAIYQSNNQKTIENRAIYDCTTVTTGSTVSLKDGAYLAIGPHQLVKVS